VATDCSRGWLLAAIANAVARLKERGEDTTEITDMLSEGPENDRARKSTL
jgi:hypothetical protein